MAAVGSSTAQAGVFEADSYSATITGNQSPATITGKEKVKHEFLTVAGKVLCTTATFHGELTKESAELTITPTYSGCTIAGLAATVTTHDCQYLLTAGATTGVGNNTVDVETHLLCPAGKSITVKTNLSTCEITIAPQTLTNIETHNRTSPTTSKNEVEATIDVHSIKYTIHNGSKCPNEPASGAYATGTYEGGATFEGEVKGTPSTKIGITVT
jgi:hypothetical protein